MRLHRVSTRCSGPGRRRCCEHRLTAARGRFFSWPLPAGASPTSGRDSACEGRSLAHSQCDVVQRVLVSARRCGWAPHPRPSSMARETPDWSPGPGAVRTTRPADQDARRHRSATVEILTPAPSCTLDSSKPAPEMTRRGSGAGSMSVEAGCVQGRLPSPGVVPLRGSPSSFLSRAGQEDTRGRSVVSPRAAGTQERSRDALPLGPGRTGRLWSAHGARNQAAATGQG